MSALNQKLETFTFQLAVSGLDLSTPAYADRLYEAGCQDAVVFIQDGQLFLEFDRQAPSYEAALTSATADIAKAGGTVLSQNHPSRTSLRA